MIKRRLGNGMSTRFWYDNWSPFGQLDSYLKPSTSRLGISKNETLSNSMGGMYMYLCEDTGSVPWEKVVWSPFGIPRHDFLAWLVVLDRCPTRDRLLSWGLTVNPLCLLCNSENESRDHLFFKCDYTHALWSGIAQRCNLLALHSWNDTLTQLQGLSANRSIRRLTLMAVKATIYWIWNERNSRLHRGIFRDKDSLFLIIDRQIRNRISSLRVSHPTTSSTMMQCWLTIG